MVDIKDKLVDKIPKDKFKPLSNEEREAQKKEQEKKALEEGIEAKKLADEEAKKKEELEKKNKDGEENEEEEEDENTLSEEELELLLAKPEEELTEDERAIIEKAKSELEDKKTNIELLIEADGYDLDDDFIQELAKDGDSFDALAKYTAKVAEMKAKSIIDSNPIVSSLYNHLSNGGSYESFKQANTEDPFSSLKLSESTNEGTLESVIKHDLSQKGVDEEDINAIIKTSKKDGKLFEKATKSHESIKSRDESRRKDIIAKEQQRILTEQQLAKQEAAKINEMFSKNKFGEFSVPVADLNNFKEAFVTPVDANNNTILDKKWEKLTTEQKTILDYIVFKDFNIRGLNNRTSTLEQLKFRKKENDKRPSKIDTKRVSLGHSISPELKNKLRNIDFKAKK